MDDKIKVIIITGPTGVGKTKLSIEIAKKYNGEIISADSMQIYKDMNIGTAKVTVAEMEGIEHHLINIVEPTENFSVSDFQKMAIDTIKQIHSKNKIPIIVGGTGLYLDSIIYTMDFNNTNANHLRRAELEYIFKVEGKEKILEILKTLDSENVLDIDIHNPRRVMRAIEIIENTGTKKSFKKDLIKNKELECEIFVLKRDREHLYDLINKRVDIMIKNGLINEVKSLKLLNLNKNYQSMKAIGYRQIDDYLEGDIKLEKAIELVKRDSRRYAKRQMTWFKKYENATVIDVENIKYEEILKKIYETIEKTC